MAVTFIVEDGTGLETATSYLSVADFKQYWEDRGMSSYLALPDNVVQPLLNRATQVIGQRYCFQGYQVSETQALDCPRTCLYNKNNIAIASDIVPKEVENATAEIAGQLYQKDTAEGAIVDPNSKGDGVKSKSLGPMSIEYNNSVGGVNSVVEYTTADMYLKPLVERAKRR